MRVDRLYQALNVGILPVVCVQDEEQTEVLIAALKQTPIRCAEILFRHDYAPQAVKRIKERYAEFCVGAGTILDAFTLERAIRCGADFIVSPGLDPEIVTKGKEYGVPVIPGCATPSEMMAAQRLGCEIVKFFPAESYGGPAVLQLLASALEGLRMIPTGGIQMGNLEGYLRCRNVLACGGSFMAKRELLADGDVEGIVSLCREALSVAARTGRCRG